jgi:hypothetical protein
MFRFLRLQAAGARARVLAHDTPPTDAVWLARLILFYSAASVVRFSAELVSVGYAPVSRSPACVCFAGGLVIHPLSKLLFNHRVAASQARESAFDVPLSYGLM